MPVLFCKLVDVDTSLRRLAKFIGCIRTDRVPSFFTTFFNSAASLFSSPRIFILVSVFGSLLSDRPPKGVGGGDLAVETYECFLVAISLSISSPTNFVSFESSMRYGSNFSFACNHKLARSTLSSVSISITVRYKSRLWLLYFFQAL